VIVNGIEWREEGNLTGWRLSTETVEGSALSLESVDDVEGSDGLPLGVLGVSDRVADDVLEEDLEDTSGLLVDEARDTLDTTSTGETTDSGLGDTLDVVSQNLPVPLGTTLAETFAAFSSTGHCCIRLVWVGWLRIEK